MKASRVIICLCILFAEPLSYGIAGGSEPAAGEQSFSEKVGGAAKKIGKKIEEGFTKAAKKLEDKHVPEKVEQKLKKAADKTAEGFSKAERKIKQKLAD